MSAVQSLTYKYQTKLQSIILVTGKQCPPPSAQLVERESFRFVQAPMSDNCFLPQGLKSPQRVLDATKHSVKCSLLGLSMFATEASARTRYSELKSNIPNIKKTLGTHLAKGVVQHGDGVATPVDKRGHFDFYEVASISVKQRFTIIGEL